MTRIRESFPILFFGVGEFWRQLSRSTKFNEQDNDSQSAYEWQNEFTIVLTSGLPRRTFESSCHSLSPLFDNFHYSQVQAPIYSLPIRQIFGGGRSASSAMFGSSFGDTEEMLESVNEHFGDTYLRIVALEWCRFWSTDLVFSGAFSNHTLIFQFSIPSVIQGI